MKMKPLKPPRISPINLSNQLATRSESLQPLVTCNQKRIKLNVLLTIVEQHFGFSIPTSKILDEENLTSSWMS